MPNCSERLGSRSGGAVRCAVCDSKFGLVRYYSWQTSPLFQEARRSLHSSPGKLPQLTALAPNRLRPGASESREGSMTFQISQRGKEYLKTAQTLLRAAETMTDRAIAGQLKALADDYQRRAEKASHVDAAKAFARSAANAEDEWRT
jgi:hypothetical protein